MTTAHLCVGAVLHREGRVLLGRRAASRAWLPGVWDIPGGHCNPGEAPEDALVRELREELGVTPLAWEHLASASDADLTLHIYRVSRWAGTPRNRQPEEHDAIDWVPVAQVDRLPLAHPGYRELLRRAARLP